MVGPFAVVGAAVGLFPVVPADVGAVPSAVGAPPPVVSPPTEPAAKRTGEETPPESTQPPRERRYGCAAATGEETELSKGTAKV